MSEVIKSCKFYHLADWGSHSCLLYEPTNPKSLVEYGTCDANKKCPYKNEMVQQLKTENEELQEECERLKKIGSYGILQEVKKNKQIENCLDEIEEIINFIFSIKNCDNAYYCKDKLKDILQLIKQAKEGGE